MILDAICWLAIAIVVEVLYFLGSEGLQGIQVKFEKDDEKLDCGRH